MTKKVEFKKLTKALPVNGRQGYGLNIFSLFCVLTFVSPLPLGKGLSEIGRILTFITGPLPYITACVTLHYNPLFVVMIVVTLQSQLVKFKTSENMLTIQHFICQIKNNRNLDAPKLIILYLGIAAVCQTDVVPNLMNKHKHSHKNITTGKMSQAIASFLLLFCC